MTNNLTDRRIFSRNAKAEMDLIAALKRSVVLVVMDASGVIREAGSRYLELVGLEEKDVIGQSFLKLHQPRTARDLSDIWNSVLRGEPWRGEMQISNLPGNTYWLDATLNPVGQSGNCEEIVLIGQDISIYKKDNEDKANWLQANIWLEKVKKDYLEGKEPHRKSGRPLSLRETQVLKFVAEGLANKNIASRLDISVRTVEIHRAHLMRKLGIKNTAALVKYAIDNGYVS